MTLAEEIAVVLNRHSAENGSDTPDFILAQYLLGCLATFNKAVLARSAWYGSHQTPLGPRAVAMEVSADDGSDSGASPPGPDGDRVVGA